MININNCLKLYLLSLLGKFFCTTISDAGLASSKLFPKYIVDATKAFRISFLSHNRYVVEVIHVILFSMYPNRAIRGCEYSNTRPNR